MRSSSAETRSSCIARFWPGESAVGDVRERLAPPQGERLCRVTLLEQAFEADEVKLVVPDTQDIARAFVSSRSLPSALRRCDI